ncbi:rhodanese-like domain-containing protein [Natrinema sp. HArc-T2]|uniref:rhodanese-like domain-containing protein n=1 Tax=Natrinema sp. HArc-T2 TaxID=3242701 RepID=UPI00359DD21B
MAEDWIEDELSDLPPSANLVYKVLEYNGRLSQKQLVDETRLSSRTLHYAIGQLENAGLVESHPAHYDARQTCYTLVRDSGCSTYSRDALVDPDWVDEQRSSFQQDDPSARLVYVGSDDAAGAVIPGSVVLNVESDLLDPNRQRLPDRTDLEELLGSRGATADTSLVLYDDGEGYHAAYVYWLLAYYGHRNQRLLDGGLEHWVASGYPTTHVPGSFPSVEYTASGLFNHVRAYRDDVVRAIGQDTVLLDVRQASEYRGQADDGSELSASTPIQGHIPGAINIPLDRLFDGNRFASRSAVEDVLAAADITGGRKIIVYCGVGARSALAWVVLSELLGYPEVMNYDGSWTEWGSLVDVPVETE